MVVFCWYSISMLFVFYKLISVLLGLDWHTADILLVFDWYPDGILLMPIHSAGILLSLCLRFPGIRLAWHSVGSVFCFFRNWSNQNAVPELAMFPYRYFAVFRLLNCCFHLVRHVLAWCVDIYSGLSFFACSHCGTSPHARIDNTPHLFRIRISSLFSFQCPSMNLRIIWVFALPCAKSLFREYEIATIVKWKAPINDRKF